jgi:hypothetical protein
MCLLSDSMWEYCMECWTGVLFSCACMDSSTPEAGITWETRFFPLRTWETNAVFPPAQVETKTFPSPLCMLLFPPMLHGLHRSLLPSRAIPSRNLVQLGSINFFSQSKSLSIQVHIYSYHQSSVVSTSKILTLSMLWEFTHSLSGQPFFCYLSPFDLANFIIIISVHYWRFVSTVLYLLSLLVICK